MHVRTVRHLAAILCLIAAVGFMGRRASAGVAITDPAKAGPDFRVQGEYVGEANGVNGPEKVGAQVVALGKGEFNATFFAGGLPGAGWNRGDASDIAHGKTADGVTKLTGKHTPSGKMFTATIKDGAMTMTKSNGDPLGELKKVERKSPTLGEKPLADAVVLFDGTSAAAWKNGRLVDGDLLNWGVTSKQEFTDYKLHLEFECSFMPDARGQGRSNSGVYQQSRYEVQVLDSFGLPGENDDCGAIYKIANTRVNMSFPPLNWQTYDIDFTAAKIDSAGKKTANARITVRHNGVLTIDNVEIPHPTTAAPIGNEKTNHGPLYLQDHGNPVLYRNIWLVEKK
ncbi:MAG TPA: DUF1080 domain-containing protein [Pirellulales bacterium]|nr:DUF1080 domain-containing protein [Pirellulales bacterium]